MQLRHLFPLVSLVLSAQPAPKPVLGVDPAYLNRTEKPCSDFYGFANGAYDKEPIPGAYAAFGVNQEIDARNEIILKALLEAATADGKAKAGSAQKRIGDFFASGMDEAAIAQAGIAPLQTRLARIDGLKAPQDLAPLLASFHAEGLGSGFRFHVGIDDKDSSKVIAHLNQGGLGLPERDYYFRDDEAAKTTRAAYGSHVARMLELSGLDAASAKASAIRVMALETRLSKASKTLVDLRDPQANYHKVERAALATLAPGFGWEVFLQALGLPASEKHLLVGQPQFFKAFAALTTTVPLADWKAYLRWHLVHAAADSLSKPFEEESFAFYGKTLSGRTELLPRWKRMLHATDAALGEDLGQLFVQKAFSPEAKAQVKEMIHFHKAALRASILRATWMGEASKKEALRKLDTMREKIGYPDTWRDYSTLQVKRQPHALNVLAGRAFEFRRRLAKLGRPVDRTDWLMTPQTNNAYYEPTLNEICLPAGILQPPFYDAKADAASNYGSLASTIGHEILHGFDDQGSQYDADGNLKNWWTEADRKAYDAMTATVVRQYDAFEPLPGLKIRGKQTLGENLADIGGLKVSFEAWKLATFGKPQPTLDGLSPEQRFFVAFAQGWRTNVRPEYLRTMIQSDVHSPVRERVLGPVSALPEFQKAFGCGEGEAMTAMGEKQFRIW